MKGIVSAGDKRTATAGTEILRKGGNAYDAAAACMFAAHVAEPALTSPAGGGFLLSYNQDHDSEFYDFFVDVPPNRVGDDKDFYPIDVDFGSTIQVFHIGHASMAVPGVMKGILSIHKEKGRLPLEEIVKPAVHYAKTGLHLTKFQTYVLEILAPIFIKYEDSRKIYAPNGGIITPQEKLFNPEYANFLQTLAHSGDDLFYTGEIADRINHVSSKNNGLLRKKDLVNYTVHRPTPIQFEFRNYRIITSPPPSMGGLLMQFTLNLLNKPAESPEWGSKLHLMMLIEAMRTTQIFRSNEFKEIIKSDNLEYHQFDPSLLKWYASSYQGAINPFGNTTHFSIMDTDKNVVTCTSSNGEGAGIIIPDTGIMMNNMLGEEDLNPDGFFKWPEYVRLPSMMAPTIILKNNEPHLVLGSSGSNRIRSAMMQTMLNTLMFGMDIENAITAPRLHMENDIVYIEPGFDQPVVDAIENHYSVVDFETRNLFFGGVQAVMGNMTGASDMRREGWTEIV